MASKWATLSLRPSLVFGHTALYCCPLIVTRPTQSLDPIPFFSSSSSPPTRNWNIQSPANTQQNRRGPVKRYFQTHRNNSSQPSTLLFPSSNFLHSAPSGPAVALIFLWLGERIIPRAVDIFTLNATKIRKPFSLFFYIFYINKRLGFFTLVSAAAQGRRIRKKKKKNLTLFSTASAPRAFAATG
ncbi:hypothetical protein Pyn_25028 [Prunus yedoensis var. nudiflora]|uniref:Uncharacterized protein n=1 Tax=Prunus yedoensis var. nudiflora TaxID=2094558 RepID=A0A314Z0D6_PRUYE|nr:hypothetical protein Pyn_25028 [Prunus yedoensis var. nudiflora]